MYLPSTYRCRRMKELKVKEKELVRSYVSSGVIQIIYFKNDIIRVYYSDDIFYI